MNCSSKGYKGFMLLVPMLIISLSMIAASYMTANKMRSYSHAAARYRAFIEEGYQDISCANLSALYSSYDPHFLMDC